MYCPKIVFAAVVTSACLVVGCAPSGDRPTPPNSTSEDDLVSVNVRGTDIDVPPNTIDVIVADPPSAVDDLLKRGARRNEDIAHSVYFRGILHLFFTPMDMNSRVAGHVYEEGDVVFYFFLETEKAKEAFVKRYSLKEYTTLTENKPTTLYVADPRHYVALLVKGHFYTCPMHPHVSLEKEGKCPVDGMDLIHMEGYR